MMRFTFVADADQDMGDIAIYLQGLPQAPALRIGKQLQDTITAITRFPGLGRIDERLTKRARTDILRFPSGRFTLFYHISAGSIRILAVLPSKRDIDSIMRQRLG